MWTCYDILLQGGDIPESVPAVQYAVFSLWQQGSFREIEFALLSYWKRQLGGSLKPLEFPMDKPRKAIHVYKAASLEFTIPEEPAMSLQQLGVQPARISIYC